MATDPAARALGELYGAPLGEFLARRKQLVAELRGRGETDAARAVAAAAKPTRTAWALNQVTRARPELVEALMRACDASTVPSRGGEALRQAMRDFRERIQDIVRATRDAMSDAGMDLNATQARRLGETLQAACAAQGEARDRLVAGTLARDLDADDPLALLGVGVGTERADGEGAGRSPKTRAKSGRAPDAEAERRREKERLEREATERALVKARDRVEELERAARESWIVARKAQGAADRAAREAERATRDAQEADQRAEDARKEVERLGG